MFMIVVGIYDKILEDIVCINSYYIFKNNLFETTHFNIIKLDFNGQFLRMLYYTRIYECKKVYFNSRKKTKL